MQKGSKSPPCDLVVSHAFGHGSACKALDIISLPDEDGDSKEHVLMSVGQQVVFRRSEDGRMKFLPFRPSETCEIVAVIISPNRKFVAVSEYPRSPHRCSIQSRETQEHYGTQRVVNIMDRDSNSIQGSDLHPCRDHRLRRSGVSQISIYHIFSGACLKSLQSPSAFISTLAFSPDSNLIAAVGYACHYGKQVAARERLERQSLQSLFLWQWEKEHLQAHAPVNGEVSSLSVLGTPASKFCIITNGWQHFKAWTLTTEKGLKAHAVVLGSLERCDNVLVHQWNDQRPNTEQNKYTDEIISGAEDKQAATEQGSTKSSTGKAFRLLVIAHNSSEPVKSDISRLHDASSSNFEISDLSGYILDADEAFFFQEGNTLTFPLTGNRRPEALTVYQRGFCIAGTGGYIALFECQEDTKTPYVLVRSLAISNSFTGAAPSWTRVVGDTSGSVIIAHAKDKGLFVFPLGNIDLMNTESDARLSECVTPLVFGQLSYDSPILDMDVSQNRPVVATCGSDGSVRIWNHVSRRCDLAHQPTQPSENEKPVCVALHPMGLHIMIGFADRVCLFSVLFRSLKLLRELQIAKCRALRYSHGGHQIACATWLSVLVLSSVTLMPLYNFTGHDLPITCVVWAPDDLSLFSAGVDGNVCSWDLANHCRLQIPQMNCNSQYHALAVRTYSRFVDNQGSVAPGTTTLVAGAAADGRLRFVSWKMQVSGVLQTSEAAYLRSVSHAADSDDISMRTTFANCELVTALAADSSMRILFTGTASGSIRVHEWPDDGFSEEHDCFFAHVGAVSTLRLCARAFLFSAGADGIVFMFSILSNDLQKNLMVTATMKETVPHIMMAVDVVQITTDELEDSSKSLFDMCNRLENLKAEMEFALHRKDLEWEAELKRVRDVCNSSLAEQRDRFQALMGEHQSKVREHQSATAQRESIHVQITHELANRYERQLAAEMERYDALLEEIDRVQQRCDGLLRAQSAEYDAAVSSADIRLKRVERELRQQLDKLHDDAKHNEQMFREVLDQQEHEYEAELQELMMAAQAELTAERENAAQLTGLVQAKNTKMSQLEKRMDELKTSSHARDVLLIGEQVRNSKLEATLCHFKRHMEERETTLEDKELTILDLRRKNVTLDNFRSVLDHRVQQLMGERGPVMQHVGGLETHIMAMYDELEAEYYEKKRRCQELDSKDMKILTLGQENRGLRGVLRKRDAYIASFKRELSTMVTLATARDIEKSIRGAYHNFVREEQPQHPPNYYHICAGRVARSSGASSLPCVSVFDNVRGDHLGTNVRQSVCCGYRNEHGHPATELANDALMTP